MLSEKSQCQNAYRMVSLKNSHETRDLLEVTGVQDGEGMGVVAKEQHMGIFQWYNDYLIRRQCDYSCDSMYTLTYAHRLCGRVNFFL